MKIVKIVAAFLALVTLMPGHAADLTAFKKRFEFIRNEDGTLRMVRDNTIQNTFSVRPYLKMLKERLLNEQFLMGQKSSYDANIRSLFAEDRSFDQKEFFAAEETTDKRRRRRTRRQRNEDMVIKSLRSLRQIDVEKVFADPKFADVMSKFSERMTNALELLDLRVVAHVQDSSFFYKKTVGHQVVSWAINYAKRRLDSVPALNTVVYALVQIEELIRENRYFRQNMLLHYIENSSEEELGITLAEANTIMSSIYESRIEWFNFWESRNARNNWEKYGVNKFFTNIRFANTMIRNTDLGAAVMGDRLNYAFQEATVDGERVIYNVFHTDHQFTTKPALAYSFDRPNYVKRKRAVVKLAELGVSFLTLPSWIKDTADGFLKSIYKQQEITEGGLYAYFEERNDEEGMLLVKKQLFNPFARL